MAIDQIHTNSILNQTVTPAKLASGAAVSNIGYTPVNQAGDTITGRLRINGSGFSNSTGLVLNNNGFERVAPEMYSLPMGTYWTGSTWTNQQVRIGTLQRNGNTSLLHAKLVRHGDMNYAQQVLIYDLFVQIWGAEINNFCFFATETARQGQTGNFASDASGNVYYHDSMLWEQQTYLYIYDMYNFNFSPASQNYNGSLPWRSVASNASNSYEVTLGT